MKFRPKVLQQHLLAFIANRKRVNVFAGMGSGKTTTVLWDIVRKQDLYGDNFPVIVFAPLYVANGVWSSEVERFAELRHLRCSIITGSEKNRLAALDKEADIYIINYENAHWLFKKLLNTNRLNKFKTVVCDESTKIKNHRRRATDTANGSVMEEKMPGKGTKTGNSVVALAPYANYWYNLSGTPTPKDLVDLWGQCFPIDLGQSLGLNYDRFKIDYCEPAVYGKPTWGHKVAKDAQPIVLEKIKPYSVMAYAEDYYNLDTPIVSTIPVSMTDEMKKQYFDIKAGVVADVLKLEVQLDLMTASAITMKLRQFCSGKVYYREEDEWVDVHNLKLLALKDYCQEHSDEPIIVVYYFRWEAPAIKEMLGKGCEILTHQNSKEIIDRWNKGEIPVLLLHPQSAGHGLNLQHGGRRMIFYTLDYNLETHEQVAARIGVVRQFQSGYERGVFIDYLVMMDSIEVEVAAALQQKRDVVAFVKNYLLK